MASLDAVTQRWKAFLGKVEARLAEIEAEAKEGLTDIIATEVIDPAPLSGALQELKARFRALTKKVDQAWDDTISVELDKLEDVPSREVDGLQRQGDALRRRITQLDEALEAWAQREAATRLRALAEEELAQRHLTCAKCGAPLPEPPSLHRPENVTCTHCQALNTVRPGLAMAMYFAGGALAAKARASAQGSKQALAEAERRFNSRRHPSREDAQALTAALDAHWREVCLARGRQTPGWTEARLEGEVQVKVSQAMKPREEREAHRWDAVSFALGRAAAGDEKGLGGWLTGDGGDLGFGSDELLEMTAERDDARALDTALSVAWQRDAPDEPKAAWTKERREDLRRLIRRKD
ncbi:MAG: hypothetical protein AMXMBFR34_04760 [Myxococcaceae bacterium]